VAVLKDKAEKWDEHCRREQELVSAFATVPAPEEVLRVELPPLMSPSSVSLVVNLIHCSLRSFYRYVVNFCDRA
jgi:hypothetical protein